ncbi:Rz1-like lysis system protein LysC [Candidatus Regiella insecticola]|uniref:Rz1-like lysis system protein LysC n=1 Tax=Candidatus Regiella insecticola TaxID=138073 RepID=UPI003BB60374
MHICLCLLPLLTGCVPTQTKYLPAPRVLIPATLLGDCQVPVIPEHMTWGDSVLLNEQLLLALEQCNQDKAALRQIETMNNPRHTAK